MVFHCKNRLLLTVAVFVSDDVLDPCLSLDQPNEVANSFCGYKVLNKEVRYQLQLSLFYRIQWNLKENV